VCLITVNVVGREGRLNEVWRERERERESGEGVVRETTFKGGGQEKKFSPPILNVPRQRPLILQVQDFLREGKALRNGKR
jgi:hypothetical protein